MEIQQAELGSVGLVQELPDGTIVQLGLTKEQSQLLQMFLATLSKEKPLVRLPKQYNLTLANKG